MINLLMKLLFSLLISLNVSIFLSSMIFERGTTSYNIAFLGLGLVLTPTFYRMLQNLFATKLIVVEKEMYDKILEEEMRKAEDET